MHSGPPLIRRTGSAGKNLAPRDERMVVPVREGLSALWIAASEHLTRNGGTVSAARSRVSPLTLVQATGARFCLLFGLETEPENYRMVVEARDPEQNGRFVRLAMENGVGRWP